MLTRHISAKLTRGLWSQLDERRGSQQISQINGISTNIATAVEQQSAVTRDMSANMHVAAQGVESITTGMNDIANATRQVDEATRKVKEASRAIA